MRNNLAIIVLMWNDYKNSILCLKTLLRQTYQYSNIFLVDNNSNNGSFEKVRNWLNFNYSNLFYNKKINKKSILSKDVLKKFKIFILRNHKNLGCGYGHNTGYALAINNKFEYIARIDNDMIVPKDFFKKIIKNFKNPLIQAVSPKILYSKNKDLIWWKGTKIGNSLKFQKHMRDYPYKLKDNIKISGISETDSIAGCASIMRSKRMEQVGLSDKDFFYGPEDVEYSKRLFTKKGSIIVDLNSKIYHSISQSFIHLNEKRTYFEYKYRLVLISKIGKFSDKFLGYTASILKLIIHLFLSFKLEHRFKIKPIYLANLHFYQKKYGEFDRKNI
jgi:GT2 family glycosyltransferase